MALFNRTYRIVDGERIEGSWRPIFINNGGRYYLTDLKIYADGMVDCWELVDLATFQRKVASGWVATNLPQGAQASGHHLASWKFDQPSPGITAQELIAEVADEVERLAGRETSVDRCQAAIEIYVDEPSDANREVLRAAYFAVPEHLRVYLLGDMDAHDWPLRVLITPVGERLEAGHYHLSGQVMQSSDHEAALAYFHDRRADRQRFKDNPPAWEDDTISASPSVVRFDDRSDHTYLANGYSAAITIDGTTYPTVEHAYWALATTDIEARERIMQAPTFRDARAIGAGSPLRPDWNIVRLAVMSRIVREKFRQHPELAVKLIATGDGRLLNGGDFSRYWSTAGRNWLGRILEMLRAELVENLTASD